MPAIRNSKLDHLTRSERCRHTQQQSFKRRLTFVSFDSDPHMTRSGARLDTDTIVNVHYGALLHDPADVAADSMLQR